MRQKSNLSCKATVITWGGTVQHVNKIATAFDSDSEIQYFLLVLLLKTTLTINAKDNLLGPTNVNVLELAVSLQFYNRHVYMCIFFQSDINLG